MDDPAEPMTAAPPVPVGLSRRRLRRMAERELVGPPAAASFGPQELAGLPAPVRRYFVAAIDDGTPLATTVRLQMRGRIRLGRWIPFTARQVLAPHRGFLWDARAAGVITGYDRSIGGIGEMDFRLLGIVTVMHAEGPDIDRSAAGRAAAEAVWLPTALLPRFGVEWTADDARHLRARFTVGDVPVDLRLTIDADGHPVDVVFDRWGDPDGAGAFGWHRFGGEITRTQRAGALTLPTEGRLGWHYGTPRWQEHGEFFRYRLTRVLPVMSREDNRREGR